MNNQQVANVLYSILIAITSYFCIEAFYNLIVNFNSFIFMNPSDFLLIITSLFILIVYLIIEFALFNSEKLKEEYRIYLLIFLITILRILAQFIILPSVILLINSLLFISLLIFFIEYFYFTNTTTPPINYSITIIGIIIGIEFQFLFLLIDISYNATASTNKLFSTFLFIGLLIVINYYLFFPKKIRESKLEHEFHSSKMSKETLTYFHFIILGMLFMLSMIWIFNPMALSVYDIFDLIRNGVFFSSVPYWFYGSYGFTFYIFLILGFLIASYFISNIMINNLRQKNLKVLLLSTIIISCLLNSSAIFFLESNYTYFSTIYLLIISVISIFSIVLYLSYLIQTYSSLDRKANYRGLVIFIITVIFFIILQEAILQALMSSLILNVITLITPITILVYFTEFRKKKIDSNVPDMDKSKDYHSNKRNRKRSGLLVINIFIIFILLIIPDQIEVFPYLSFTILLISSIIISIIILNYIWKFILRLTKVTPSRIIKFHPESWRYSFGFFLVLFLVSSVYCDIINNEGQKFKEGNELNPTFMTWNIHHAIGVDKVHDLNRIVSYIKSIDPDILLLNEVDRGVLMTGFVDTVLYIAHKLQMRYYYGDTYKKHYSNAIFSKFVILDAENINLPRVSANLQSVIKIRFVMGAIPGIWTIFGTHLAANEEDLLLQVPFIISEIEKVSLFERIVWMGDFNFEPSSIEYSMINSTSSLNFTDTYRFLNFDNGFTSWFDKNNVPQKRIDYILCSPDLIPLISTTLCTTASDHCALSTSF